MPTYDASNAECAIFTDKAGLLAAAGHDLQLGVTRFSIELSDALDRVEATFDARSLKVVGAVRDGRILPTALSEGDRRKIEAQMVGTLESERFGEVRFSSTRVQKTDSGWQVEGRLTLHGQQRAISAPVRSLGDRAVAEVVLHQPDFGIRPFTAVLGGLKIKPDVRVRVSIPRPG